MYNKDSEALDALIAEYEEITRRLDVLCREKKIDTLTMATILDLSHRVLMKIAQNYTRVKKGVGTVMVGPVLELEVRKKWFEAEQRGLESGMKKGLEQGMKQGMEQGMAQGEDLLGQLMDLLLEEGRIDDAKKAATDAKARKRMYKKYGLDG